MQKTVVVLSSVRGEREGGKLEKRTSLPLFIASNLLPYARLKAGEPGNETTPLYIWHILVICTFEYTRTYIHTHRQPMSCVWRHVLTHTHTYTLIGCQ